MEVDFDKEIDALLRQDGRGRTITISEFSAPHLDADDLSAFAENALPDAARKGYMMHLADCDHCRSTLSALVMLNAEAEPVSAVSSVGAIAHVVEKSVPWYKSLFAIQNLAYGMGALLILFTGFIGYTLLQGGGLAGETAMSVANKPQPAAEQRQTASAANASANIAANSMPMAANSNASSLAERTMNGEGAIGSAGNAVSPSGSPELKLAESFDGAEMARSVPTMAPPPPAAAPAPEAQPKDLVADVTAEAAKSVRDDANTKEDLELLSRKQAEMPSAGNVVDSQAGPNRNVQRDNRMERGRTMAKRSAPVTSGTRSVGGKTFNRRDGVWYDAAYSGQATTNIRRNTDAYQNLDRGLRAIAESLDGVVVVVGGSKAYRIQ